MTISKYGIPLQHLLRFWRTLPHDSRSYELDCATPLKYLRGRIHPYLPEGDKPASCIIQ